MRNCLAGTDDNGQISACPYLQESDTDGYASNCPVRTSPVNETVTGLLDKLPGCITVTDDPAGAPLASMVCASSVTPPYVTPTSDSVAQVTVQPAVGELYPEHTFQQFIGCYNDSYAGQRALDGASTTSDTMDVASCQAHCNSAGYRLSGVEYSTQCCEQTPTCILTNCVNSILHISVSQVVPIVHNLQLGSRMLCPLYKPNTTN